MTSEEVKERVQQEIAHHKVNKYGWEFHSCLLEKPELRDYGGEKLWTVLIESNDGYHVVYDPKDDRFGLAAPGCLVGIYGGLLETLDAI
tara:strand:+ start:206 stop:472 length:267 start_codon:yes stop_codon:yes gene_type:complete